MRLEGDVRAVLGAIVRNEPGIKRIYPGGGIAGANSTGFAAALQKLQARKVLFSDQPIHVYGNSVGASNALAEILGQMRWLASRYPNFCCRKFIDPSHLAWFRGTKISLEYYRHHLTRLVGDLTPAHMDSRIHIGVTHYETGEHQSILLNLEDMKATIQAVIASAYLPYSGPGHVLIDGVPYTDGGISNPLPYLDIWDKDTKGILIIMPHSEAMIRNSVWIRYGEQLIFRVLKRRKVTKALREVIFGREQLFRQQLKLLRWQLAMGLEDPRRRLPPTVISWPDTPVEVLDTRRHMIVKALNTARQDWETIFHQALAW